MRDQSHISKELRDAIQTLEAVVLDRSLMGQLDQEERKRLVMAAGMVSKPDRLAITKLHKTLRKQNRHQVQAADRAAKNATAIRKARESATFVAPVQSDQIVLANALESAQKTNEACGSQLLHSAQRCYVCKKAYRELHFFYDSMCVECGNFNYSKRFQTADLRGRTAVITGSRVKIGFHVALMMLRGGATVIATTRFPHDSARRFREEKDFESWADRLHVFGLDLRHAPSVELFARFVSEGFSSLDFLINNAAQTVRRPRGFYAHLLEIEGALPRDQGMKKVLESYQKCRLMLENRLESRLEAGDQHQDPKLLGGGLISYAADAKGHGAPGLYASARMSQLPLLPDDLSMGVEIFPEGRYDADQQQVDLRPQNSWRMKLSDVPTAEMLEIQLVNAVAPFILCSKLKPMMLRKPSRDKHIVNVSAMEGKFSRYTKTDKHPHTNMAKAGLNMMVQTSAPDYAEDGIHMNAVDTGWVTDEDPHQHATRKRDELGFQPPLDIVDGAARICDPIFSGLNSGSHLWGKFLKDFLPTSW